MGFYINDTKKKKLENRNTVIHSMASRNETEKTSVALLVFLASSPCDNFPKFHRYEFTQAGA